MSEDKVCLLTEVSTTGRSDEKRDTSMDSAHCLPARDQLGLNLR